MDLEEKSWESLTTLVVGLAEREYQKGDPFLYDRPDGHPNSPVYGHLKLPHLN